MIAGLVPAVLTPFLDDGRIDHSSQQRLADRLGAPPRATVRPPLLPIDAAERKEIRSALEAAQLLL